MPPLATPTTSALSALRTRLITTQGIPPAERRVWENVGFVKPNPPQTYIEDHWLGGPEEVAALGNSLYRGTYLYQVTVVVPGETGAHPAMQLADAIVATMRNTSIAIVGSAHPARITQARVGPPSSNAPGWWALPVTLSVDMDF